MSSAKVVRTNKIWLTYVFLCCYVFFINLPGPINGFLKDEFQLDYTMLSLHASAFAVGIVVTGLFGYRLIKRLTHWQGLALGATGLGLGGLIIGFGRSPYLTITGLFVTGLIGTLILSIYPTVLKEEMGEQQSVGISEANVFAAIIATLAPLVIGFSAARFMSWRPAVLVVSSLVGALGLWSIFLNRKNSNPTPNLGSTAQSQGRLPLKYWVYWTGLMLGVSVEFCTIYYSSLYAQNILNLSATQSTQALSLFFAGGIIGRLVASKLVKKFGRGKILVVAIFLALLGFGLFWLAPTVWTALLGLFLMGLGVSNFYTMVLSLALDASNGNDKLAGSRATLASGLAILVLPLLLGYLADQLGIRLAFGLVGVLIVLLSTILRLAANIAAIKSLSYYKG